MNLLKKSINLHLVVSILFAAQAYASDISHVPLYAGGGAKPNVLFIVDDSGSMQSAVMKSPAAINTSNLDSLSSTAFLVGPFNSVDDFDLVLTRLNSATDFYRGFSEDEDMILSGGAALRSEFSGYWGAGYIDYPGNGGSVSWTFNSQKLGDTNLNVHYANGSGATRYLRLYIDGVDQGWLQFPATASWSTWGYVNKAITVTNPAVKVELVGGNSPGGPNLDAVYMNNSVMDAGAALASLCPGVNLLAYDPNKVYLPWSGHTNSTYPLAQKIPHQPGKGTTNLANARYVLWQDDGDGIYEFGECGVSMSSGRAVFDLNRLLPVSALSAEQKQNFANWYTYHRTREYAVKAGLSPVLADLRVRAGLSTIHIHNQPGVQWGMNIVDVDNFSNPALQSNKDALMAKFYDILYQNPWNFGGTPLRRTLENAGLYFHLDNNSAVGTPETRFLPSLSSAPFLPANEGGQCQSNHMVLVTDGYQFEYTGQGPRFNWGNVDVNAPSSRSEAMYQIPGLHSDSRSNTLADIAMYFAITDAAPNMTGNQIVNTHAVSFGVYGNISGFPTSVAEKNWPNASEKLVGTGADPNEYLASLDDLVHAAFNGGGRFMTATDAISLRSDMQDLMRDISNFYRGTATAITFDRQGVNDSTIMFRTLYDMDGWTGKLNAYNFNPATGAIDTVNPDKWEASARLDLKNANNKRKIVTFNGVKGAPFVAPVDISAPVLSNGEINVRQIDDLLADKPVNVTSTDYLQDMIEYLRQDGDGYTTSPSFRSRTSLGDIVNSAPVYVAAPDGQYPSGFESTAYSTFVSAKANRTPMVYVGANDGMLHGFNVNTGDEVFAYIPQGVYSSNAQNGLHFLADRSYFHLPYVDETPAVGDVFTGGAWRTLLVSGLGRGGKSVFVLDVTDPAAIATEAAVAQSVVVNEFMDSTLGYTFGTPKIAKMRDGEWVAIFGNGYNNNTDGKAYLYVLYLDGAGPGGVSHLKVGPLGTGSVSGSYCENAASDCNGLSSPTIVDLDLDGKVDRVYAGDLHGNLWAFDFTKDSGGAVVNSGNPTSVAPTVVHRDVNNNAIPFFTACWKADPTAVGPCVRQPITTKPSVVAHFTEIDISAEPNLMVYFGTGRYLSEGDILTSDTQTFYGVWDSGSADGGLLPINLTEQTFTLAANGTRTMSSVNAVAYTKRSEDLGFGIGNYGWRLDLSSRERVIQDPKVVNGVVIFPTLITSNNLCSRSGTGFIMGVDVLTGGKPPFAVFPDQSGDIGIAELSGGELVRPSGGPPKWFASDPDNDVLPTAITIVTEPRRTPSRTSWTIMK